MRNGELGKERDTAGGRGKKGIGTRRREKYHEKNEERGTRSE